MARSIDFSLPPPHLLRDELRKRKFMTVVTLVEPECSGVRV